jgi:hypothetical protein
VTKEASRDPVTESSGDHRSLAASLAPALNHMCDDRLGAIGWFKADWQRGGAATGTSTYRIDDGREVPVVLKLPVVGRELLWMTRLQDDGDEELVVPKIYACGSAIGGYDLTWIVMERFEHGPLGLHWSAGHVPRVADAAARFHRRAGTYEVNEPPAIEDWDELVAESITSVKVNAVPEARVWTTLLKKLRDRVGALTEAWRARDARQWIHGDLHLANAMSRTSVEAGPVTLIDLAEVRAGSWIEDAVYFERQLWARPERMKKHKPVKEMAAARRRLGLPVEDDYARLAMIRRALLAGTAPRFIRSEGHPKHLAACRGWIERALAEL